MVDLLSNMVFEHTGAYNSSYNLKLGHYQLESFGAKIHKIHKVVASNTEDVSVIPWTSFDDGVEATRVLRWFALELEKIIPVFERETDWVLWVPWQHSEDYFKPNAVDIAPFATTTPFVELQVPQWYLDAEVNLGPVKRVIPPINRVSRYERGDVL